MQANPCGHSWIIRLSEQKDEQGLDAILHYALHQLLHGAHFDIYINKYFSYKSVPKCVYQSHENPLLSDHDVSQICTKLRAEKAHISSNKKSSCYFPISHNHEVIGFVLNHGECQCNHQELHTLSVILTVYANQLHFVFCARKDPLTELLNRQTFDSQVQDILFGESFIQPSAEQTSSWYLAMIDIDHFKQVNDTFGHVIGDEVIILVARMLELCFRHEDYLFRYGGEEFAVLMQCDSQSDTFAIFDRVRRLISERIFPQVEHLTISIGYCQITEAEMVPELVQKADSALYHAKRNGRNQVIDYATLQPKKEKQTEFEDADFHSDALELF